MLCLYIYVPLLNVALSATHDCS